MRGPAFRSLASDGRATLCAQTRKEQHRPDRVSSRRPFERRMRVPCRLLSVLLGLLLAAFSGQAQVQAKPLPLGWQSFEVPDFGTRVDYPARIFGPSGETRRGVGQRLESPDHRATLSIYATDNDAGETPGTYLRRYLRRSGLDYRRVTPSFFAISMERGALIYYSRCNFSHGSKAAIHCFDLIYPRE